MKKIIQNTLIGLLVIGLIVSMGFLFVKRDKNPNGSKIELKTVYSKTSAKLGSAIKAISNKRPLQPQTTATKNSLLTEENEYFMSEYIDEFLYINNQIIYPIYMVEYFLNNYSGTVDANSITTTYGNDINSHGNVGKLAFNIVKKNNILESDIDIKQILNSADENFAVDILIKIIIDYDYKNNTPNSVKVTYSTSLYWAVYSLEYDFVNNKFKGITIDFNSNDETLNVEKNNNLISAFNSGEITYKNIKLTFKPEYLTTFDGEIPTKEDDSLKYKAYRYSKTLPTWNYNSITEKEFENLFNSTYRSIYKAPIRTKKITNDYKPTVKVNNINNIVAYAFNKSYFYNDEINNQSLFLYSFISYENMVNYIEKIKTSISSDSTFTKEEKETIDELLTNLKNQGKTAYTGDLIKNDGSRITFKIFEAKKIENKIVYIYSSDIISFSINENGDFVEIIK